MKKFMTWILLFCLAAVLYFGSITVSSSMEALSIWFEKLFPSLFVGLVLIKVMDEQGILISLSKAFFRWSEAVFRIKYDAFSLVLGSFFLGSPTGQILIDDYVKSGAMSLKQGQRLAQCLTLSTPSFMILTCGVVLLGNIQYGFMIWVSQILSAFVLLFLTRREAVYLNTELMSERPGMFASFRNAIVSSGVALYFVGGYLLISIVFLNILTSFSPAFLQNIIKSIGEFTLGCNLIASSSFSMMLKILLMNALLGFSGFSVHLQVMSLTPNLKLNYGKFFLYRLLQTLISSLIIFVLIWLLLLRSGFGG